MKIKLFTEHNQNIELDLEKLEKKMLLLDDLLLNQNIQGKDLFQKNFNHDHSNHIDGKKIIEYITLLLNDFGIEMNFKEVQNIIKKANPSDSNEQNIMNLKDALNLFWVQPKMIHQGNIFILYKLLTNNNQNFADKTVFRTSKPKFINHSQIPIQIFNFEKIPVFFDQLINFINDQDAHISPFIDMQIIQLHSLAISPFENYNFLLSKILSIWYFIVYGKDDKWSKFPIDSYLETLKLNKNKYLKIINQCLISQNYTDFIDVVTHDVIQYQKNKNLTEKVSLNLHKEHVFLADHEKKFLFIIVYYEMNEFDWKRFKNITNWKFSKQFIIRNLSNLEKCQLLISSMFKNRKFFYQSDKLIEILYQLRG